MSAISALLRMLAKHGETLSLTRSGQSAINVKAKRFSLSPENIAGSMDDAAFTIKISNAEIAAAAAPTQYPRQGDTIGNYVILACDTRKDGEVVAIHILTVGGGHS